MAVRIFRAVALPGSLLNIEAAPIVKRAMYLSPAGREAPSFGLLFQVGSPRLPIVLGPAFGHALVVMLRNTHMH